jgi:hypothetical protein
LALVYFGSKEWGAAKMRLAAIVSRRGVKKKEELDDYECLVAMGLVRLSGQ